MATQFEMEGNLLNHFLPYPNPAREKCPGTKYEYVRLITASGGTEVKKRCVTCGKILTGAVAHSAVPMPIELLEIFRENRSTDICAVDGCNENHVERHHFMPHHLAPSWEVANSYPVLPLCRKHHREWHERVTPYMNGNKRIVIINFCPICQKRVDMASVQNIAEPLPRWQVHCCEGAWCHITSAKDGKDYVVYMAQAALPARETIQL